jgi:type IV pilus assembly protein PilA
MNTATTTNPVRRGRGDGGFTLIELMVVVMIIGILLAIGVPTFLGARSRAYDTEAKSNVRNAMVAAQTMVTETRTLHVTNLAGTRTALLAVEPNLKLTATANTNPPVGMTDFYSWGGATSRLGLSARSQGGTCYGVAMDSTGIVKYVKKATNPADCRAGFMHQTHIANGNVVEGW